jgi:hypothetical protein
MNDIEQLQKQWRDSARFRALRANVALEKEGVVLGAGTVLAKRKHDGALELDGEEARVLALLAVALGRPVGPAVLRGIRHASKCTRAGDDCMASMHIALAGVPKLPDPLSAAQRLFIADGLIASGVSPRDIFAALEFDSATLDALKKFDQNEARNPAGDGRVSGEWTNGGATLATAGSLAVRVAQQPAADVTHSETAEVSRTTLRVVSDQAVETIGSEATEVAATTTSTSTAATILNWLAFAARYGSGPAAFLAAMFYSPPAGGNHDEGDVPGRPDLRYSWNEDENELRITRASDGKSVFVANLDTHGAFSGPDKRVIARYKDDNVVIDGAALPSSRPKVDLNDGQEEPQLCPEPPVPDSAGLVGRSGDRAREYELFLRVKLNGPRATPAGLTYGLPNPEEGGKIVKFDECQHEPGAINESGTFNTPGSMIETKGPGYAEKFANKYYGTKFEKSQEEDWTDQGTRQMQASHGRAVIWYFAEQSALDYARKFFSGDPLLKQIRLEYAPWAESSNWK